MVKGRPVLFVTGSLNYDVTLYVDRFAPPKAIVKKLKRFLGGSGGNSAVAAARILGRGAVVFFGAVGKDRIGEMHVEALNKEGVITDLIRVVDNAESGQAYVAVNKDGETAIYSYYGANLRLTPEEVGSEVLEYLSAVKTVLIMNPPLPTALELAGKADALGKLVIWDPGAYSHLGIKVLAPVIKYVNILAPNEGELLSMTGHTSIRDAAEALWRLHSSLKILVKRGDKGSLLLIPSQRKYVLVKAIRPEDLGYRTVSTVGCGDSYIGVFSALLTLNYSEIDAMRIATCAATLNATKEGPRGVPKLEELLRWFEACKVLFKVSEGSISNLKL